MLGKKDDIQNISIILASLLIYLSICTEATFYLRQSFANGHVLSSTFADMANIHDTVAKIIGSRMARNRAWKLDGKRTDGRVPYTKQLSEVDDGIAARELLFLLPELSVGRIIVIQNTREFTRLQSFPMTNSSIRIENEHYLNFLMNISLYILLYTLSVIKK